ncbi:MAG: efflux RND transporter periplasmic adaptor subunit [Pseudomonadota bacterium]
MNATVTDTERRSVGFFAIAVVHSIAVLAVGLGLIFAIGNQARAQEGPAAVGVGLAKVVSLSETAPILGQLVAPTRSTLAARVVGVVADVPVKIGDVVSEGDLLVMIDRERLEIVRNAARASREQAQASVTTARANFDLARQAFERLEQLRGSAAFSRGQFDDAARRVDVARSAIAEADARLAAAEAALSEADYNLRHTQVRAPVSGTVIDRQAQVGQYLTIGAPVITVLDNSELEIEANVPATLVGGLERGIQVRVTFAGGTDRTAALRAVIPDESVSTRTRPVRFTPQLNGMDSPLAAGQSVTVHIPIGVARDVLTVPKDALVQGPQGWIVYVADGESAERRPVTLGSAIEDRLEITSGLSAGDIVVTRGNERLRPGQPISYEPPEDASASEGDADNRPRDTSGTGAAADAAQEG